MKPKRKKKPDPYLVDAINPEWTTEMFRRARPAVEVVPDIVKAYRRERGRPLKAQPKEQITLRLSPKVLAFFRRQGRGWQTKIDNVLGRYVARKVV